MFQLSYGWLALLVDASVKSLLLAAMAGAALAALRIRNANLRHRVWTAVLAAMLPSHRPCRCRRGSRPLPVRASHPSPRCSRPCSPLPNRWKLTSLLRPAWRSCRGLLQGWSSRRRLRTNCLFTRIAGSSPIRRRSSPLPTRRFNRTQPCSLRTERQPLRHRSRRHARWASGRRCSWRRICPCLPHWLLVCWWASLGRDAWYARRGPLRLPLWASPSTPSMVDRGSPLHGGTAVKAATRRADCLHGSPSWRARPSAFRSLSAGCGRRSCCPSGGARGPRRSFARCWPTSWLTSGVVTTW